MILNNVKINTGFCKEIRCIIYKGCSVAFISRSGQP